MRRVPVSCAALLACAAAVSAADLPSFRGVEGSGVMPPWRGPVVSDGKRARVLWTSQERHFGVGWGYGSGPENKNRTTVMGCGFSGPVATGGSVFFSWFVPSGDVVDEKVRDKGKDKRAEAWKVDADDIMVCMDAGTGRTRWKAVMRGKGLNWAYHRKCPWTHACVVGGKVYWVGSAGRVYCHAAADGSPVWESDTGEGFREFEKMRAKMRQARSVETWQKGLRIKDGDSTSPTNSSPCYGGGVIVVNDSLCDQGSKSITTRGAGLVGLDAASGRRLWRLPNATGAYVSPVPHREGERELVVSVAPERLVCVDPRTGRAAWQIAEPMGAGVTPAIGGGYLLVQRHRVRGRIKKIPEGAKGLTCYRLASGGAEKVWEKEPGDFSGPYGAPAIAGGHGYAQCRIGLVCVELRTGEVTGKIEKVGDGYLPLQIGNGLLLTGTDLVATDPAAFRRLGRINVSRETFTAACISEGRVYVRGRLPGYENKNRAGATPPEPGCIRCVDLRR